MNSNDSQQSIEGPNAANRLAVPDAISAEGGSSKDASVCGPAEFASAIEGLRLLLALSDVESTNSLFRELQDELPNRNSEGSASLLEAESPVEFLDRFEVLRKLGEGGSSTVLLARDKKLGREVAVKIYAPRIVSSERLQKRFLFEAQTLADLQHAGIVPVFDVGIQGALWFIVMEYCSGPTLGAWLREQPDGRAAPRIAAHIVRRLSHIVHFSHSRGKLHRDIKPSNVLLENDAGSQVPEFLFAIKLSDFGLTRNVLLSDSAHSDDIAGTPWYMAPEQVEGKRDEITVQTDVYGLGVLLYELLTGAAPFAHLSAADWWRRVGDTRPAPLRKREPRIPRDLEAICLKCIEKRPKDRYSSAQLLEEDLNLFLAGKSVSAQPVGVTGEVYRWARRSPGMASLVGCIGVLMIIATCVISMFAMWEHRQRVLALRRGEILNRAIDELYTQIAEIDVKQGMAGDVLRERLLRKSAELYEAIATEEEEDPARRFELSQALHRTANVQALLGRVSDVVATRRRCIEVLEELLKHDPDNPDYEYDRSRNLLILGPELWTIKDFDAWKDAIRRSHASAEKLAKQFPERLEYSDTHLSASLALAEVYRSEGDITNCLQLLTHSLAAARQLETKSPSSHRLMQTAAVLDRLGIAYMELGRYPEAVAVRTQAVSKLRQVQTPGQEDSGNLEKLAMGLHTLGRAYVENKTPREAHTAFLESTDIVESLVKQFPDRVYLKELHADIGYETASVLQHQGRREEATELARRSLFELANLAESESQNRRIGERVIKMLEECPVVDARDVTMAQRIRERLTP